MVSRYLDGTREAPAQQAGRMSAPELGVRCSAWRALLPAPRLWLKCCVATSGGPGYALDLLGLSPGPARGAFLPCLALFRRSAFGISFVILCFYGIQAYRATVGWEEVYVCGVEVGRTKLARVGRVRTPAAASRAWRPTLFPLCMAHNR